MTASFIKRMIKGFKDSILTCLIVLVALCAGSVREVSTCIEVQQPPAQDQNTHAQVAKPPVEQIVDKYVEALGGIDAARGIFTIKGTGTFELIEQGIGGNVEFHAKAPNLYALSLRTRDDSVFITQAFDGSVGWERAMRVNRGRVDFREIKGAELEQLKLNADFGHDLRLRELYPSMTLIGLEKVEDRDTYLVEASPRTGNPEAMYFDKQTGLLLRRVMIQASAQGRKLLEIYYGDYRVLSGTKKLKVAFSQTLVFPGKSEQNLKISLTEARANEEVPDSIFSPPRR
jgi:hypothetical protein